MKFRLLAICIVVLLAVTGAWAQQSKAGPASTFSQIAFNTNTIQVYGLTNSAANTNYSLAGTDIYTNVAGFTLVKSDDPNLTHPTWIITNSAGCQFVTYQRVVPLESFCAAENGNNVNGAWYSYPFFTDPYIRGMWSTGNISSITVGGSGVVNIDGAYPRKASTTTYTNTHGMLIFNDTGGSTTTAWLTNNGALAFQTLTDPTGGLVTNTGIGDGWYGANLGPNDAVAKPISGSGSTYASSTLQKISSPRLLFNPPPVGQTAANVLRQNLPQAPLLYLGAGKSGIVRQVAFTSNGDQVGGDESWNSRSNHFLRYYVDGGDMDSNNPTAGAKYVDIPLQILMGSKYHTVTNSVQQRDTRFLGVQESPTGSPWSTNVGIYEFDFKLPQIFTNGVLVGIWDNRTNGWIRKGFSTVTYEIGPVNFDYCTWRLRSRVVNGTFMNDTNSVFLSVAAKPGMMVGLFGSFNTAGSSAFWENIYWRLYAPPTSWNDSSEDIFRRSWYGYPWTNLYSGFDSGLTTMIHVTSVNDTFEGYRWFFQDAPTWQNGATGYSKDLTLNTQGGPDLGNTPVVNFDILTLYYAP